MFDANLRYHEKGDDGFCEVYDVKEGTKLWDMGVRKGDVLYFKMLSIDSKNPRVKLLTQDGSTITMRSWDSEYDPRHLDFWIVYSGNTDLTGFLKQEGHIREKSRIVKEKLGL